jgi:hypothetical protein
MRLDLMLLAAERIMLVLEGIGDDKVRVNSSGLESRWWCSPTSPLRWWGWRWSGGGARRLVA